MPSLRKTLVVSKAAVALGCFFTLLAVLHSPAAAQGRVCADDEDCNTVGPRSRPKAVAICSRCRGPRRVLAPGFQR